MSLFSKNSITEETTRKFPVGAAYQNWSAAMYITAYKILQTESPIKIFNEKL